MWSEILLIVVTRGGAEGKRTEEEEIIKDSRTPINFTCLRRKK